MSHLQNGWDCVNARPPKTLRPGIQHLTMTPAWVKLPDAKGQYFLTSLAFFCKEFPSLISFFCQHGAIDFFAYGVMILNFHFLFFFFLFWLPCGLWSSQARDQTQDAVVTYAETVATRDPLTHCAGQGLNLSQRCRDASQPVVKQQELFFFFFFHLLFFEVILFGYSVCPIFGQWEPLQLTLFSPK